MEEIHRKSKYTVLCAKCGRRNSKAGGTCMGCGQPLHVPGILNVLFDLWLEPLKILQQYFQWTYHMGIPNPRARGLVRMIIGLLLSCVGGAIMFTNWSPEWWGGLIVLGYASVHSGSVEVIFNRNMREVSGCLRFIILIVSTVLYCCFLIWMLTASR